MIAIPIHIDDWDPQRTVPHSGLSTSDRRAVLAAVSVMSDPSVAHPAAAVAALLRHFAKTPDDLEVRLSYAAAELTGIAKDGVHAAIVDLGIGGDQ